MVLVDVLHFIPFFNLLPAWFPSVTTRPQFVDNSHTIGSHRHWDRPSTSFVKRRIKSYSWKVYLVKSQYKPIFKVAEKGCISLFRASTIMSASSQRPICPLADLSHSTAEASGCIRSWRTINRGSDRMGYRPTVSSRGIVIWQITTRSEGQFFSNSGTSTRQCTSKHKSVRFGNSTSSFNSEPFKERISKWVMFLRAGQWLIASPRVILDIATENFRSGKSLIFLRSSGAMEPQHQMARFSTLRKVDSSWMAWFILTIDKRCRVNGATSVTWAFRQFWMVPKVVLAIATR